MKKIVSLILVFVLSANAFAGKLADKYFGEPFLDNGKSSFSVSEKLITDDFEIYSNLDQYGRCGVAYANISKNLMPTTARESIGMIKPTGWQTPQPKYDFIDGKFLYNRCHLIAYELAGENANEKNLITGTRYMNIEGMLPFENKVTNYVKTTGNHCLYRATPIYENDNLLCEGVQIEAYSIEDNGTGIDFNVFCYNVQPGVVIDYKTGKDCTNTITNINSDEVVIVNNANTYVINKKSKKIHIPTCSDVKSMSEKNKVYSDDNLETLKSQGYAICGTCKAGLN